MTRPHPDPRATRRPLARLRALQTFGLGLAAAGAPKAVIGVVIAALVLLPEGLAAVRAARADRLQTSMNLALGSALASIGLTMFSRS